MTKERRAQAVTVAVLAVALGIGLARTTGWRRGAPAAAPEPQDTVYAMLNAARAGDVKTYLGAYTGAMEAALRQSLAESTEMAFAQYLRDSTAELKGTAVAEPEQITATEVKIRVEYVYQDRNEVQPMVLEQGANGWKISRTEGEERVKTLVPYGTPVK